MPGGAGKWTRARPTAEAGWRGESIPPNVGGRESAAAARRVPERLLLNGRALSFEAVPASRVAALGVLQAVRCSALLPLGCRALADLARRTDSRCSLRRLWVAACRCHSPRQGTRPRRLKRPASWPNLNSHGERSA